MIYHLTTIKDKDGKPTYLCSTCKQPPKAHPGAHNTDDLAYVWTCWNCNGKTLAEWATTADREKELQALLNKAD